MTLAQKYHDLANEVFNPNMVNDPEDTDALIAVCRRLLEENGMVWVEDFDEHACQAFFYRAVAMCELGQHGFVYHREDGKYVLETMANTTARCFDTDRVSGA